jgi:hypothetical protein
VLPVEVPKPAAEALSVALDAELHGPSTDSKMGGKKA